MKVETYYRLPEKMKTFFDQLETEYDIVSITFEGDYNLHIELEGKDNDWEKSIHFINEEGKIK